MKNKFINVRKTSLCLLFVASLTSGIMLSCSRSINSGSTSIEGNTSPGGNTSDTSPTPPIDTTFKPVSTGNYFYSDQTVILGNKVRTKPQLTGSLPRYPIPTLPQLSDLTATEIDAIYLENQNVMDSCEIEIKNGTLKKHIAADGQFYGNLPENAQAVKKEILIDTRRGGGRILGFAPAGEVIKVTLPRDSITIESFIGYEEPHFNIPREKFSAGLNRMPTLEKAFVLQPGDNFIGTPFGGAVSIFIRSTSLKPFKLNIEGVIENPSFEYGITTNEQWNERRLLPGLTAEVYTRYARLVVPSSIVRNTIDMEEIAAYWYKAGCLSTYANNQEFSRSYPVSVNFDNYVAAGGAVNVGGKFTMQPLGMATNAFNPEYVRYNHTWGNMHELNHSFQNSGNVRWGIEESGEVTNNVLSVLSMISYTDIALKRNEEPMPFRDNSTDPYNSLANTMKWYNDPSITDYTKYWDENGHHYNYFVFSDMAHAFGVDNVVKFIRSYGDGSCPPLQGYDSKATNPTAPATISINRRDFILRAAKVLGYDMTYYLNVLNKMNFPQAVIDEVKALNKPEFKPAANLYAYGRDDGTMRTQSGRPFAISYNQSYDFDFVGKTLTTYDFEISKAPTAKNGSFEKQANGKYRYTGSGSHSNDPFSLEIKLGDGSKIEFFGEIAFDFNGTSVSTWENIATTDVSAAGIDQASEIANKTAPTETNFYKKGIAIPDNKGKYFHRTQGKFVVPTNGDYTFYVRADDFSNFYLSTDSSANNMSLILSNSMYTTSYTDKFKSLPITLRKGQILFFNFEVYNPSGAGMGRIGYKINNGAIADVPANTVFSAEMSDEQISGVLNTKKYMLDNQYLSPYIGKSAAEELSKSDFTIVAAPNPTGDTSLANMIDGNFSTYYYSTASGERKISLDFGKKITFNSFNLAPNGPNRNGDIKSYVIYYSNDGETFTKIKSDDGVINGKISALFDTVSARYFMLEVLSTKSVNNLSFAELNFGQDFDSREGIVGIQNDKFTYSSEPQYETKGIIESNYLVLLSKDMTATVKFNGKNLAIFARKSSTAGKMEVIVDGISLGVIDLNDIETLYRHCVFLTSNLSSGEHTLVIKCIEGTANLDFIQTNKR